MSYLNEVQTGQVYSIAGIEYEIINIRATNITSPSDYCIAVTFRNDKDLFDANLNDVLSDTAYVYLRIEKTTAVVVSLFSHCKVLTVGKEYDIIGFRVFRKGSLHENKFFKILDDNGKKREYQITNSMFELK